MSNILPNEEVLLDILKRIIVSSILFVLLIILSFWQKLKMERMIISSFIRGFCQLLLLSLILIIIFSLENLVLIFSVLLMMCLFAAFTTKQRYPYPKIFMIETFAISFGSLSVISLVLALKIIPDKGSFIIPMGGMVIANVMVMTTIVIERMIADIKSSHGLIETALALNNIT